MGDSKKDEIIKRAVKEVLEEAKLKKRSFIETVELQFGLQNIDPQKDKRFYGLI